VLDKAVYSAFKSTLNSAIVSYRIVITPAGPILLYLDKMWHLQYY